MHRSKKIVLDFDGTIFRLFTNYDLSRVVSVIYGILKKYEIGFTLDSDAFDSFFAIYNSDLEPSVKIELLETVNGIIANAEIDALETGIQVDGFFDFIKYCKENDIALSVASNNSPECIEAFFDKYCNGLRMPIVGRNGAHPELMKPNTFMLAEMCKILSCNKDDIIFVGDNVRDYECASAFSCEFIGLTPTEKKKSRMLSKVSGIEIVRDFYELKSILCTR